MVTKQSVLDRVGHWLGGKILGLSAAIVKEKMPAPEIHRGVGWKPKDGLVWSPLRRWPVNEPCYCGSGRKAKKCCLPTAPATMEAKDAAIFEKAMTYGAAGLASIRAGFAEQIKLELAKEQAQTEAAGML